MSIKISMPLRIEYFKRIKPRYLKSSKLEKITRIYDRAKTPYQRVLECKQVNRQTKQKLKEQYDKLNPAELRRNILIKLDKLRKIKN